MTCTTATIRSELRALPLDLERRIRCNEKRWLLTYAKGQLIINPVGPGEIVDTHLTLDLQSRQVLPNLE